MVEVRVSEEPVCDFCSEPKYARRSHCADFSMDHSAGFPELRSKGDWLACSVCGNLIDAENWIGLLQRAVDKLSVKYNTVPRRILADGVKRSHDLFKLHYQKAKQ